MTIEYLKKIVENPVLDDFKNRPMSIEDIEKLEKKYNNGKEFPKAFREYLFLAGNFNNFGLDDLGEGLDELQNIAKEELDWCNQKIDRPFFTFSVYDSCYSVIFLDETNENPKVYLVMPFLAKRGTEQLIKANGWEFKALVEEYIHRVKNNIPF